MTHCSPDTVGAQLIVRIEVDVIFPNCPRLYSLDDTHGTLYLCSAWRVLSLPSSRHGRDSTRSGMSCRHAAGFTRRLICRGKARPAKNRTARNARHSNSEKKNRMAPVSILLKHPLDCLRRAVDGRGLGGSLPSSWPSPLSASRGARAALNIAVLYFAAFRSKGRAPRQPHRSPRPSAPEPLGLIGNVIWLLLAGWWACARTHRYGDRSGCNHHWHSVRLGASKNSPA